MRQVLEIAIPFFTCKGSTQSGMPFIVNYCYCHCDLLLLEKMNYIVSVKDTIKHCFAKSSHSHSK